jgi:hypothetical protein
MLTLRIILTLCVVLFIVVDVALIKRPKTRMKSRISRKIGLPLTLAKRLSIAHESVCTTRISFITV